MRVGVLGCCSEPSTAAARWPPAGALLLRGKARRAPARGIEGGGGLGATRGSQRKQEVAGLALHGGVGAEQRRRGAEQASRQEVEEKGPVCNFQKFQGSFFFYLINRDGQQSASENRSFIMTFHPRRLRKTSRIIFFVVVCIMICLFLFIFFSRIISKMLHIGEEVSLQAYETNNATLYLCTFLLECKSERDELVKSDCFH